MVIRGSAAAVVMALALAVASPPAGAQNSDMRELLNRLDRMQRELSTLQQAVYRGSPPPQTGAPPPAVSGGLDQRIAARMEVRLTQLETELRRVAGKAEEIEHAVGQFNSRLEKLVSDIDARLAALEQGRGMAAPGGSTVPPPPPRAPAARSQAPDAPPSPLGTLPPGTLARRGGAPEAAKPALPAGTPKEQYEYATSLLLADQNIEEAERALLAFIEVHPKHELASNAHYWLGETYYVRKNFQQAAYTFADGFQKFPKSEKAPDNLLKLGMSLGQLGKSKQACTAFSRLIANFPESDRTLKSRVAREQRRLKCP